MKIAIRILIRALFITALLAAGFAAGFPVGRSMGFATGSEWALVQADLLAKESGFNLPVSYDGQQFRIVMRQPRNFYHSARTLADRREDEIVRVHQVAVRSSDRIESEQNALPVE